MLRSLLRGAVVVTGILVVLAGLAYALGSYWMDAYHARARAVFRIRGTRHALLRWVREGYDAEELAAAYRGITVPSLLIAGRADDIVPWTATERTATQVHDALVLPLDGVGHWLLRDVPERVVDAMRGFLDAPVAPAPDAPLRSPP